jgi:hypothetical protein
MSAIRTLGTENGSIQVTTDNGAGPAPVAWMDENRTF